MWLKTNVCLIKSLYLSLYLYFYFNEFEII